MKNRIEIEKKFDVSRKNLLAVVIFSVVNILLLMFDTGMIFLFSVALPTLIFQIGQMISMEAGDSIFLIVASVISFAIIALYGLCYILSKKYKGFICAALVLFSFDTLFLISTITLGFEPSVIMDIVFHIWIMYYLIVGTKAWLNLKNLPFDEQIEEYVDEICASNSAGSLRAETPKGRIILSHRYENLEISVKRLFGMTELIVNGEVYAEQKGVFETSYTLDVYVDDVHITLTMDNLGKMELYANGNLLAKKRRLI